MNDLDFDLYMQEVRETEELKREVHEYLGDLSYHEGVDWIHGSNEEE